MMIRGVLLDLSGTVHLGDQVVPGAVEAIERLRDSGRRVRFLTNTSTKSSVALLQQLKSLGISIQPEELVTSVLATRNYLIRHQLRPYCLLEDTSDLEPNVPLEPPHNCVVIGLAPSKFQYEQMNQAFRILQSQGKSNDNNNNDNNPLIAIHKAPYIRDVDGQLSMGPGGFCAALEIAANCQATIMGKPSRAFFESALWDDIPAEETCMVGDDVVQDIRGAKSAGIGTCLLVQTGKYEKDDECKVIEGTVTQTCASLVEAVNFILDMAQHHRRLTRSEDG